MQVFIWIYFLCIKTMNHMDHVTKFEIMGN